MNKLLLLGMIIPLFGINSEIKTTSYNEDFIEKVDNRVYKTYPVEKSTKQDWWIADFYTNVDFIKRKVPLDINFWNVGRLYHNYYFSAIDEDGNVLELLQEKHTTYSSRFKKTFTFQNVENFKGLVTFKFRAKYALAGEDLTIFKYQLYFSYGEILSIDNLSKECPYEVNCKFNDGYSEVFGEYYEFRNVKKLYEINTYLRFNINDLNIRVYANYYRKYYVKRTRMRFLMPSLKEYKDDETYNSIMKPFMFLEAYKEDVNDTSFTVRNKNELYVDKTNLVSYSRYKEGLEATTDFYFPSDYYKLRETYTFYLYLYDAGKYVTTLLCPINIKFVGRKLNTEFKIIGKIEEGVNDNELGEVKIND